MPLLTAQQARRSRAKPIPRKTPPAPKPKPKRRKKPSTAITSFESFKTLMRERGKRLQEYVENPRSNYRKLTADLCELIQPEHAMCLHPCNAEARIDFAEIVQCELVRFGIPEQAPHCWVTISPGRFALPIHEADDFKPQRFMQTIRQAFGDIPFLAIIEAGHYRASQHLDSPLVVGRDLKRRRSDMVSWHVHLITWGYSKKKVDAQLKPFRRRHSSMVDRDCVYVAPIEPNEATMKMLYASKGQIKSYRHYLTRDLDIDPETGECKQSLRQSKESIRTGDHVKMVEVFGQMRIDQLVFGNKVGSRVAEAIRYKAMLPFCIWAAREIDKGREDASDRPFVATYRKLGNRLRREHGADFLGDEPVSLDRRLGHNRRRPAIKNRSKRF